jgi:hypothetical protein
MKPFYFFGRVGDLPAALLRHLTAEYKEQNDALRPIVEDFEHTVSNLLYAGKGTKEISGWQQMPDGTASVIKSRRQSVAVRNIIYGKYFRRH